MNDAERQQTTSTPPHVAIIMDGNGRWAQQRGLSRMEGHVAGAQAVERLVRFVAERLDLKHLTLFAFSSENWNRPRPEVEGLMNLLKQFAVDRASEMAEAGIRLRVIGDLGGLPEGPRQAVQAALIQTESGKALNLTIALNYGARQEIARACRHMAQLVASGDLSADAIDAALVATHLETGDLPDPDLIIRTSGELRLSNFLLWQAAYAELAFSDTLWPDFAPEELVEILDQYRLRDRRFGAVKGA